MILYITGLLLLGGTFYGVHVFVSRKRNGKLQLKVGLAYYQLVKKAKLAIEFSEILQSRVIGLDRRNKKLLLIDHTGNKKEEQCIALLDIASCELQEKTDAEKGHIAEVYLELKHKVHKRRYRFCFFNHEKDNFTDLPALKKKAVSWKNRIDVHKYPGTANRAFEFVL